MDAPRYSCAVVTGASSGIGKELVTLLAGECGTLVLVARRTDLLQKLANVITGQCRVEIFPWDLEPQDAAAQLWASLQTRGLSPDLWVNDAGFGAFGSLSNVPLNRELAMVDLNVLALMRLTKMAAEHMLRNGGGTILNVASLVAFQPTPRMAVYGASKAFVLSYTQALDSELRSLGVRVLALCPGNTTTAFHTVAGTTRVRAMHRITAMPPRQVAQCALLQIHRGTPVVVPGFLNRLASIAAGVLPRSWVVAIASRLMV
ncbi:MAG TPA: SDR family oxidoreductase [Fibrobacteraceae bacterium]|nr:SDR family oxidoreductase [Fibrobacteraceae bacterium]